MHAGYVQAFSASLQTVFLIAVPISALAFALTWLLPEVALRTTNTAVDPGETFAMPADRTSLQEVEHAICVLAQREHRADLYRRLADRAGLALDPKACWLLYRIAEHPEHGVADLADALHLPRATLDPVLDQLVIAGMIQRATDADGANLTLTATGRDGISRLVDARRVGLANLLDGNSPEEIHELS